ncbi:MAG: hypothetical protein WDN30_15680 [Pararobbsia sp.]
MRGIVEHGRQRVAQHLDRHRERARPFTDRVRQPVDRIAQIGKIVGERGPRIEETRQRLVEQALPALCIARLAAGVSEAVELVDEGAQAAQQFGLGSRRPGRRQPVFDRFGIVGQCVTEIETQQRIGKGVPTAAGAAASSKASPRRAPASASQVCKVSSAAEVDAETRRHGIDPQPLDQLRRADRRIGQAEPVEAARAPRDWPAKAAAP